MRLKPAVVLINEELLSDMLQDEFSFKVNTTAPTAKKRQSTRNI